MISAAAPRRTVYPWWHLLLEGIIAIGVGLALILTPGSTVVALLTFLGLYWIGAGLLSLVQLFAPAGVHRRGWLLVHGLVTVALGVMVLNIDGSVRGGAGTGVIWLVGGTGVFVGIVGLLQALRGGGMGAGLLGLISVIFGTAVLARGWVPGHLLAVSLGVVVTVGGILSLLAAVRVYRQPAGTVTNTGNPLLGLLRVVLLLISALVGVAAIFVAWLIPAKRRGIRLHYWMTTYLCRWINRLLRLKVVTDDGAKLADLRGILFPNHVSFLDIPVIVAVMPMRFLSTADVYRVPFVGWVADSIATVFVDRSDKDSRAGVRKAIAAEVDAQPYPPFVIFPEGRFGTATSLRPFHFGSFEIAAQNRIAYLPCALHYDRPDVAIWRGVQTESFAEAAIRVLTYRGRLTAYLQPRALVQPTPDDDPGALAVAAQRSIEAALDFAPAPTKLDQPTSAQTTPVPPVRDIRTTG